VRLLLDTHILLWALIDPVRMPRPARDLVEDEANEVLFSAASIWEMSIKHALGRADFGVHPREIVQAALDAGFVERPVSSAAALEVAGLAPRHRDPFDRLLVAQAMIEPAILLTADAQLAAYSELVRLV
jgi:PIN domain nuclease of toxin-antitoxin system